MITGDNYLDTHRIVAGILDDALPNHVTLFDLAADPPALWDEQRERIEGSANFGNRT